MQQMLTQSYQSTNPMYLKQAINTFLRAVGKVIYSLFYLFSACTLVCVIVWSVKIVMNIFDASETAKDYTTYGILTMVALYVVGKTCYVISTWYNHRFKAKEDALAEELNRGRNVSERTDSPHSALPEIADGSQTAYPDEKRHRPKTQSHDRKQPPAQPIKAGNFRW